MLAIVVQQWCPWCGDHMGWGAGWLMMLFWLVLLVVFAWGFWAFARRSGWGDRPLAGEDPAETMLRQRYARGEIDEATYRRMLEELRRP